MARIKSDSKNQRVFIKIKTNKKAFRDGIRSGFHLLGKDLVKTAKDGILSPPKTGEIYSIRKDGATFSHQASRGGQYPANQELIWRTALGLSLDDSERLAFTLGFRVRGYMYLMFGSKVPHGKWLQKGTKNMKARPFLTLAVKENEKNAIRILKNEIGKRL